MSEDGSNEPGTRRRRVLIVEDEQDLCQLLEHNLSRDGFDVTVAYTGEEGLRLIGEQPLDLVLLDLMLPQMDGLEVCRRVKRDPATADVPIVMVTAKGEEPDIVTGLELGADDYITKPFSPRVLLARVRAVLRRQDTAATAAGDSDANARGAGGAGTARDEPTIEYGRLKLYPERHEAFVDDQQLELTATEFRLLRLLAGRPGRVFTRQQIIEMIHGGQSAVTDRSVDVQVVSLRRKLEPCADLIQTIRGVGYRFGE
jgi:two-component system phosphate regulon response regulator PhoB